MLKHDRAADGFCEHDGPCFCSERAYALMLAVSPPSGEELVERVAKAFFAATMVDEEAEHRTDAPDTTWEDLDSRGRHFAYRVARAILAEIERKTND